jgi:hypothetical protein
VRATLKIKAPVRVVRGAALSELSRAGARLNAAAGAVTPSALLTAKKSKSAKEKGGPSSLKANVPVDSEQQTCL